MRCIGRGYRAGEEECIACCGTGRRAAPPEQLCRDEVNVLATERAEHAIRSALVRMRRLDADYLARALAQAWGCNRSLRADAMGFAAGVTGSAEAAAVVVRAYTEALYEHGRVVVGMSRGFDERARARALQRHLDAIASAMELCT